MVIAEGIEDQGYTFDPICVDRVGQCHVHFGVLRRFGLPALEVHLIADFNERVVVGDGFLGLFERLGNPCARVDRGELGCVGCIADYHLVVAETVFVGHLVLVGHPFVVGFKPFGFESGGDRFFGDRGSPA